MLPYRSPTGNSGYGVVSRYPQVLTEADLSDEAAGHQFGFVQA
jgi:hypothetical protein